MGKKKNRRKKKRMSNPKSLTVDDFWPSDPKKEELDNSLSSGDSFISSPSFQGPKQGYVFQNGKKGIGYYKDENKEEMPPPQPEPPPMSKEEKEKQQKLQMKFQIIKREYDIRDKNLQKAHRLWTAARKLPNCETLPNPPQWILGHEHFVQYWAKLKKQANGYKSPSPNAPIPPDVIAILHKDSPLRKYMEYMYVYFVD